MCRDNTDLQIWKCDLDDVLIIFDLLGRLAIGKAISAEKSFT